MQIDIFSDTVCPWCYLGKRRLELAVAMRTHYDIRLKWRPFELNPELPLDGVSLDDPPRVADAGQHAEQGEAAVRGGGATPGDEQDRQRRAHDSEERQHDETLRKINRRMNPDLGFHHNGRIVNRR